MGDGESLPHAHVKRIIKAKLAELTAGDAGDAKRDISVQKEALAAFAEAAKIFIHYLTATANDVCHESKRRTINAEDVLKAVDEVEFAEFAEPMREALAAYKVANAEKAAKTAAAKKRKAEDEAGDAGAAGYGGGDEDPVPDEPGALSLHEPDEEDEE